MSEKVSLVTHSLDPHTQIHHFMFFCKMTVSSSNTLPKLLHNCKKIPFYIFSRLFFLDFLSVELNIAHNISGWLAFVPLDKAISPNVFFLVWIDWLFGFQTSEGKTFDRSKDDFWCWHSTHPLWPVDMCWCSFKILFFHLSTVVALLFSPRNIVGIDWLKLKIRRPHFFLWL